MGWSGEEDDLLEGDLPGAEEGVRAPLGMDGWRKDVMAIGWVREQMSLYWLG
jgi:hypothetical protein